MNDNPSVLLASAVLAASSTIPVRAAWVTGEDGHGYETLTRGGVTIVYGEDAAHPGGIVLREVRSAPTEGEWTLDALADIQRDTGLVPTAIGPSFVHSRDGRLKSFAIPATVRSLGSDAFSACVGATNALVLPAGLEELGVAAFWACENLTGDLVIPAGVERIGPETFYGCGKLTGLSFAPGSRLRSIDLSCRTGRGGAFAKCRGLRGTVDFSPCRDLEFIDPVAFVDAGPVERFVYGAEFLARKAAQLRAADAENGYPRASADWLAGAFGISTHWTFATTDQKGERNPFEEAVDAFDVPRYVAQAKRAGAQYVIFTSTWGSFHLPAPSAAVDAVAPGRTTRRNLLAELGDALHAEGIRLILYHNYGCAYHRNHPDPDDAWMVPIGFKDGRLEDFGTNVVSIVTDIARTLGDRVDGWWFDSSAIACLDGPFGYNTGVEIGSYRFPFREIALGCKAGNPRALVSFNSQGGTFSYTPCQEYFSGEEMASYPLCGRTNDQGMQMHVWCTMDNREWVHDGTGFAGLRFGDDELAALIRSRTADGCAVTLNVDIDRTGLLNPAAVDQLARLRPTKGR